MVFAACKLTRYDSLDFPNLRDWIIIRADRCGAHAGGGCVVFLKRKFEFISYRVIWTGLISLTLPPECFSDSNCGLTILCSYIVPSMTGRTRLVFDQERDEICRHIEQIAFSSSDHILLVGDTNSRVENRDERAPYFLDDCDFSKIEFDLQVPSRARNPDTVFNDNGRRLLEICRASHLIILNGRVIPSGYTCFGKGEATCPDTWASSISFLDSIHNLRVHDLEPNLSDHTPISFSLRITAACPDIRDDERIRSEDQGFATDR